MPGDTNYKTRTVFKFAVWKSWKIQKGSLYIGFNQHGFIFRPFPPCWLYPFYECFMHSEVKASSFLMWLNIVLNTHSKPLSPDVTALVDNEAEIWPKQYHYNLITRNKSKKSYSLWKFFWQKKGFALAFLNISTCIFLGSIFWANCVTCLYHPSANWDKTRMARFCQYLQRINFRII